MARRGLFAEAEMFTRRRKLGESDLDITPMIDVTFLLLIFFMVTSTMQSTRDADVPVARYGQGAPSSAAVMILIDSPARTPGATPALKFARGNGPFRAATIAEVPAFVAEEVRAGYSHVIIKAAGQVPAGVVQEVSRLVTGIEGATFSIGVQEKRGRD